MLNPSMQLLLNQVGNRYLLVNLAAQRARDIAEEAEAEEYILDDKPVKIALDEIAEGKIQYRPGARPEPMENIDLDADMPMDAALFSAEEDEMTETEETAISSEETAESEDAE